MADDGLRALERRYRDTGAVDDHARWIAARVRVGELSEHRARLAADLGHDAARLAVSEPPTSTLVEVIKSIHTVCGAIREPVAHANAHWVMTGERPPPSSVEDGLIVEDHLNARIALAAAREGCALIPLEGAWRRGLDRLEAWTHHPCDEHDGPAWDPILSREELLAAVPGEVRADVSRRLEAAAAAWEDEPWPGFLVWREYEGTTLFMPWIDGDEREEDFNRAHEVDDGNGLEILRALWSTPHGNVLFACSAAVHAGLQSHAVRLTVKAAVRAVGEPAVRAAIVRDVGPWLMREQT